MARLKLFRATSGFHDSYVAATSRDAALKAWGARTDLFAMGAAEQFDDAAILAEASKKPGTVLQKRRASGSELKARAARKRTVKDRTKLRQACELASKELKDAKAAKVSDLKELDADIDRLVAKRKKAEGTHNRTIAKLETRLEKARTKLQS